MVEKIYLYVQASVIYSWIKVIFTNF